MPGNESKAYVGKWLINRHSQGAFHQLMKELSTLDVSSYIDAMYVCKYSDA